MYFIFPFWNLLGVVLPTKRKKIVTDQILSNIHLVIDLDFHDLMVTAVMTNQATTTTISTIMM